MKSRFIRIKTGRGYVLTAILDLPKSRMPEFGWPVVILLHGWRGDKHSTRNLGLAKQLTHRGIATLRPDMAGHGKSGGDIRRVSVDTQVYDVESVLFYIERSKHLDTRLAGIVGASIGGSTALVALAMNPFSFACGVLISPRSDFGPVRSGTYSFTNNAGRRVVNRAMLRNGRATNFYRLARLVPVPVLVLHGTADKAISVDQSRTLVQASKRFVLSEINGGDHTMRDPEHLRSVVEQTVAHLTKHIIGNPR